jgi:hypothetical protein
MPWAKKILWFCLTGLAVLPAAGCVETAVMYHGNAVSPVYVVTLQENAPVDGRWETFDLIIDYEAIRDGDVLEIKGQAVLSQHYQIVYDRVRYLIVYLFFVDETARVLETIDFVDNLGGSPDDILKFAKYYKIPPGTTGISFGYSGKVMDWESMNSFYLLPL